jgi:hypothetical protein
MRLLGSKALAWSLAIAMVANPANELFSQTANDWTSIGLHKSELRPLIMKAELVAQAKVISHSPAKAETFTHIETTTLLLEKVFKGRLQAGQSIDLVCLCSGDHDYSNLVPNVPVMVFAKYDRQEGIWKSAATPDQEIYYLPYSAWLVNQIVQRTKGAR